MEITQACDCSDNWDDVLILMFCWWLCQYLCKQSTFWWCCKIFTLIACKPESLLSQNITHFLSVWRKNHFVLNCTASPFNQNVHRWFWRLLHDGHLPSLSAGMASIFLHITQSEYCKWKDTKVGQHFGTTLKDVYWCKNTQFFFLSRNSYVYI